MTASNINQRRELWSSIRNLWVEEMAIYPQGGITHTAAVKFYLAACRQLRLLDELEAALSWSNKPFYAMRADSLAKAVLA